MVKHREIKMSIDKARADYRLALEKNDLKGSQAASERVHALQAKWAAEIASGANPCPFCEQPPHGIEHPNEKGGYLYEIGCLTCPPFRHKDGSMRWVRCKAGIIPSQTVEAWNAGPDYWLLYVPR